MSDVVMHNLYILSIAMSITYILILLGYWLLSKRIPRQSNIEHIDWPKISILIAARNEADNIIACLNSIEALDYPKAQLEVIIGNDQSQDETGQLIEAFIGNKTGYKVIHLTGQEYPQTKGKARVLACLADHAQGDYFLITDADVMVSKAWAKALTSKLHFESLDMVGGITCIQTQRFFLQFQHTDWLYFMGIIHSFGLLGRPLTVVGNNMGIRRTCYEACGGYGNIPFSITEDYALYKTVKDNGYKVGLIFHENALVFTHPIDQLKGLLKQRKRWLTGGWDLPFYYHCMIVIFGAWYFTFPIILFYNWPLALGLFLTKNLLQIVQFKVLYKKLDQTTSHWAQILLYDFYLGVAIPLTALYFLLPFKNQWKGRQY